jgi:hypothetical protein
MQDLHRLSRMRAVSRKQNMAPSRRHHGYNQLWFSDASTDVRILCEKKNSARLYARATFTTQEAQHTK